MRHKFFINKEAVNNALKDGIYLFTSDDTEYLEVYCALQVPRVTDVSEDNIVVVIVFVISDGRYDVYNVVMNTSNGILEFVEVYKETKELLHLPFIYIDIKMNQNLCLGSAKYLLNYFHNNFDNFYDQWTVELNNIMLYFINWKGKFNCLNEQEDFFVVLYTEPKDNPNYVIGFLSYERKVIKLDKQKFGQYSPIEKEIYKVGNNLSVSNNHGDIKVSDVILTKLLERVGQINKIEDFLEKYKSCIVYPTTDINIISSNKVQFEEYYLIGFSGSRVSSINDKIVKQIKTSSGTIRFETDHTNQSPKLINLIYVGYSLVKIRKSDRFTTYHELKSFGYYQTEEKYRELVKKKKKGKIRDIISHLYDDSAKDEAIHLMTAEQDVSERINDTSIYADESKLLVDRSYYFNECENDIGYEEYFNPEDIELSYFLDMMNYEDDIENDDCTDQKAEDEYVHNLMLEITVNNHFDGIVYKSMDMKSPGFYLDYSKIDFSLIKKNPESLRVINDWYKRFINKISG